MMRWTPYRMAAWKRTVLVCAAIGCFLLSTPCWFWGFVGLQGRLADTSVAENRQVGLLFIGIGLIPIALGSVLIYVATRRRVPAGYCPKCGYDLTGLPARKNGKPACPECGA